MVKKFILFFFLLTIQSVVRTQDTLPIKKYAPVTEINTLRAGGLILWDTYLSPLRYSGIGIHYENDRYRFLNPNYDKLSQQSKVALTLGSTTNPTATASILYASFNYTYGLHGHLRPVENLQLLLGGSQDLELGFKYAGRNQNNPVNIDLATNWNFSFILQYNIVKKKRTIMLQAAYKVPVIGIMFVPEQGATYYEMFYLKNMKNTTHFSSFHNKYGLSHSYTVDIPGKKLIWRLGISHQFLVHGANNLYFKKNDISILVGLRHHIQSFGGRKNKLPEHFITPFI